VFNVIKLTGNYPSLILLQTFTQFRAQFPGCPNGMKQVGSYICRPRL